MLHVAALGGKCIDAIAPMSQFYRRLLPLFTTTITLEIGTVRKWQKGLLG